MKKILFPAFGLSLGAFLLSLSPVQAQVIEQRQELRNEFSVECHWSSSNGNDSSPCKVSGSQHAYQHQSQGSSDSFRDSSNWSSKHNWSNTWDDEDEQDGKVKLRWNYDDGTCQVRYTEASARAYKYFTSTDCSNGGIEIGGLVPGRAYRFQIKDNDNVWSRARRLIAR